MVSKIEPCSWDKAWVCECPQCDAFWEAEEKLETDNCISSKEYDEEHEHELAQTFEIDGW